MKRQSMPPPRRRADTLAENDDRDDPFRAEKRMRRLEAAFEAGDDGAGDTTATSEEDEDGGGFESDDDGAAPQEQPWGRRPAPEDDDEEDDEEDDSSDEDDDEGNGGGGSSSSDQDDDDDDSSDPDNEDDDNSPLESRVLRLSDVPLEQRERLLRDGAGPAGLAARERARKALEAQRSLRRASRDAPREMSSKRPVSRYREVIQVSRESVMGRDPRFPTAAEAIGSAAAGGGKNKGGGGAGGRGDPEAAARKRYAFLYDEAMPRERAELKARLKREKSASRSADLQQRLAQVEQRLRDEAARRRRQAARDELKSKEKAAVAEGKKPYFPKKSEVRAAELVARYEELKKGGKLERYMEKRRRRNAAKDHRYVPSARRE